MESSGTKSEGERPLRSFELREANDTKIAHRNGEEWIDLAKDTGHDLTLMQR
jgi:hypothetical protein